MGTPWVGLETFPSRDSGRACSREGFGACRPPVKEVDVRCQGCNPVDPGTDLGTTGGRGASRTDLGRSVFHDGAGRTWDGPWETTRLFGGIIISIIVINRKYSRVTRDVCNCGTSVVLSGHSTLNRRDGESPPCLRVSASH